MHRCSVCGLMLLQTGLLRRVVGAPGALSAAGIVLCLRAIALVFSSRSFIFAYHLWLFSQCPDSVIATNLKACNQYKLFDGQAAEAG